MFFLLYRHTHDSFFLRFSLPGRHSVNMFAPSLSLAFEAHIWFINTLIFLSVCSKFLDRHSENITCLFGDENEQYSSIVIGLKKNPIFHLFTCRAYQALIGLLVIGQFVVALFNKPITMSCSPEVVSPGLRLDSPGA